MTDRPVISVADGRGERILDDSGMPHSLGGGNADIPLEGVADAGPIAWLGVERGDLFIQAAQGAATAVLCNGDRVGTSQWLHDGDELGAGGARIRVEAGPGRYRLRVESAVTHAAPRRSESLRREPPAAGPGLYGGDIIISEIPYTPRRARQARAPRRGMVPGVVATVLLLPIVAAGWFFIAARWVRVVIEPLPEAAELDAGWSGWRVGERWLLLPGRYALRATLPGYRPLDAFVEVSGGADGTDGLFHFVMEPLPGRLEVLTGELAGASVFIDEVMAGGTPLPIVELDAGVHRVRVAADGYRDWSTTVTIEGRGETQTLEVVLEAGWGNVHFDSNPAGAAVTVGGRSLGTTPLKAEVGAGSHAVTVALQGYDTHRGTLQVEAGKDRRYPPITLRPEQGRLIVASEPPGAAILVDGDYRGAAPATLGLEPGRSRVLRFTKEGHLPQERTVDIVSGRDEILSVRLEPLVGEVSVEVSPADAEVLVDGVRVSVTGGILNLPAVPHRFEIRKEGFEPFIATVTPDPGTARSIRGVLRSMQEVEEAKNPRTLTTSSGIRLVRVDPARFEMGAPRREPGRRANEVERVVEITRAFYIGAMEVSNGEFREFRPDHNSGFVTGKSLDIDSHPAVNVTWEEAARYCNWLSARESLPQVYAGVDGRLTATRPPADGYRLPTEAEWALAVRYAPGVEPRRYPWGTTLPVPPGFGNFADRSAAGILDTVLADYDDGYPATAPVESFAPDNRGLYNTGGNAAEWVHDLYTAGGPRARDVERDPAGPVDGTHHVIRGGGWATASVSQLRLTFRDYGTAPRPDVGFRVARNVVAAAGVPESKRSD